MKITIDTKSDSQKDLRKVVELLQHILDGPSSSEVSDSNNSEDGIFNLFGESNEPDKTSNDESNESPVDMFGQATIDIPDTADEDAGEEKTTDTTPEIIPY